MFTGIVQGLCPVRRIQDDTALRRITVALGELADGVSLGASVAINGTCLTVTAASGSDVTFDVIRESLDNTNLGGLEVDDRVNVERSFRVGDEVGGHIVSGHVSARVQVADVERRENERNLVFSVPGQWMRFLHHKGYVALDGASLTIAAVDREAGTITVCLIPETISRTTLGSVKTGDWVNLEIDAQTQAVVETVERVLSSPEWLRRFREGAGEGG